MTLTTTWSQADAQGQLTACRSDVRRADFCEIASAINRRLLLTYQGPHDYSQVLAPGQAVATGPLSVAMAPPLDNFRRQLSLRVLAPQPGLLGGDPVSPTSTQWLWPLADGDEGKVIVGGQDGVLSGQVGLLNRINGSSQWTDPMLVSQQSRVRAVHLNEVRRAVEVLYRGRWKMPVYLPAGIFSMMPDAPWIGELVANNGSDEVRSVGFALLSVQNSQGDWLGLRDVTVRSACIELTTDLNCQLELYRCLRPVEFRCDLPTWDQWDPAGQHGWSQPGGLGSGDAELIGSIGAQAGVPAALSGSQIAAAIQSMIDGQPQNLLVRRADSGWESVGVKGCLTVEFDLNEAL